MSNSDHSQDSHSQGDDHDHGSLSGSGLTGQEESLEDGLEVELSDQDYYDPHDDHAYYHDQNRRIEESWLEWERQTSISNPQNGSFHNQNIFQKPGSTKRRERRQRLALAQWNAQSNRSGSASSSASGSGSASGLGSAYMPGLASGLGLDDANSAAVEKLRRLGTYRPALASSMVHSFSDSSWEATQTAREKRLATKAGPNGTGVNIICALPIELLSHIVSHLEPNELFNASLVCQLFYHVVNADSCWKEAFIKFFGASVPFKRLDPKSWRGEYIKRTRLLRRWEKGRGSNVLIDPKIGEITKLWIGDARRSDERWFLAGGLAEGVVAKCNPLLGKVQKDAVLRMAHVAHVEVAVMAMDQHRVVWGLTTGEVSLTTLAYGTAGQMFQAFVGFHNGPVTCIKLVPNHLGFFLTGGVDGVIKLWDVFRARCVREFTTGTSATQHNRPKIDHICCEPGSRIVAGTSTGEIYVWEADIKAIMAPPPSSTSEVSAPIRSGSSDNISTTMSALPAAASTDPSTSVPSMMPKVVKLPEEPKGVKYLEVEFMADRSGLILTHAADARVMHLYSLHTLEHLATLKSPAHFTPITAVHWDSLKHEQPMISLSNSVRPAMSSIPHVRQGMPSLLATGDQSGNICLWYLADIMKRQDKNRNLHPSQARQDALELEPTCVLKAHDSKVSSLFVDKLIIVSGSADGSAKAWNPVNGKLISVLSTGYIRGHDINDTNSSAVKCLAVNSMQCRGILSIGRLVRSWDFSPDAGLAKEKHRRNMAKKQVQYSGGPKNRIQNYIRHSLEESVSLKQLEEDAKDRREQLHRRYNNLEGLNMVDMTDEEVVEYVMMLSKEHDDQEAAQLALEMQQIHEMEEELALKRQIQSQIGIRNGGEGPSKSAAAWNRQSFEAVSSNSAGIQDDFVTEQEMEEEEELVRRAIAMSMLDMESSSSSSHQDHFHQEHSPVDSKGAHIPDSYEYKPINWGPSDLVDVDTIGSDELERQEDHQIVQSILRELEEEDAKEHNSAEARPSISQSASAPIASSRTTSLPSPSSQPLNSGPTSDDQKQNEPQVKKMTWSMVARTNPGSSATAALSPQRSEPSPQQPQPSSRPLAIIKQYPRSASQEEIEDEDTQLARILSLSMVEK